MGSRWQFFSIWLGWQWGRRSPKASVSNMLASTVIAAGIFTVIVGLATGQGLQEAIDRKVATFHGEVQLRGYQQVLSSDAEALFLSPEDIQRIESQPSFAGGQWFSASFKAGMASADDQMLGAQLMGFDAIPPRITEQLVDGRLPIWPSNEVLISTEIARQLQLAVDSSFEVYFSRDPSSLPTLRYYTVAGLYETGLQEWDATMMFCHERQIQKINRWEPDQHQAWVYYGDHSISAAESATLREILPLNWDVYRPRQDFPQLYQWLDLFDTNTWILGIILTLVAAFNSAVVVFIRVIERRKALAILRTMGLSSNRLTSSMLALFSRSIIFGVIAGNSLALLILWAQSTWGFLPLDAETYYVNQVPVSWNWPGFLAANLLIFIAVLGTSILPAKILSKFHPSQVLRMQ
ncbi:hypothetical protein OAV84_02375 [Schleiferiaceae bacterium]|nr:hypothetical protein [Schleiferiaceae bacterium]